MNARNIISSIVIIALTIGAIVYGEQLQNATTELDTIKSGFKMIICGIYMTGVGIIVRLENKN